MSLRGLGIKRKKAAVMEDDRRPLVAFKYPVNYSVLTY